MNPVLLPSGKPVILALSLASTILGLSSAPSACGAAVLSVSIPQNSQCPLCRPSLDNIWSVSAPPNPLDIQTGIGIILNPTIGVLDYPEFALHQNSPYFPPSPPYIASHTPDPTTAVVTFTFDSAQIVSGIEIAQHQNGITRVEGRIGNALGSLTSLGSVFGPAGDIISGSVVPIDGTVQRFDFGNTTQSGTIFQFIVRKTVHPFAFATYRVYPLDQNGLRIPPASTPDPLQMIQDLVIAVAELNLVANIENSLDAKLDNALKILEDHNQNNDVAACNSLSAFINETEAQSGTKIAVADAEALIDRADAIRAVLGCD